VADGLHVHDRAQTSARQERLGTAAATSSTAAETTPQPAPYGNRHPRRDRVPEPKASGTDPPGTVCLHPGTDKPPLRCTRQQDDLDVTNRGNRHSRPPRHTLRPRPAGGPERFRDILPFGIDKVAAAAAYARRCDTATSNEKDTRRTVWLAAQAMAGSTATPPVTSHERRDPPEMRESIREGWPPTRSKSALSSRWVSVVGRLRHGQPPERRRTGMNETETETTAGDPMAQNNSAGPRPA
jgi:hypothetical protein